MSIIKRFGFIVIHYIIHYARLVHTDHQENEDNAGNVQPKNAARSMGIIAGWRGMTVKRVICDHCRPLIRAGEYTAPFQAPKSMTKSLGPSNNITKSSG